MPERAILFLAIAQTLIWASAAYLFPALLLWWEGDLGWSRAEITGAFTAALFVSAAFSPLAGRLIDRGFGPQMMGLSTLAAGVLVGLLSQVTELWQFYTVWLAIGVAISGCLYEPCFALITRARGLAGRPNIVTITLFAGFASTISFPLAHAMAQSIGWRSAVLVFASIAVFVAAPLMFLGARTIEATRTVTTHPPSSTKSPSEKRFLLQPAFWLLGAAFALGAFTQQVTIHHMLAIFDDKNIARDIAVLAASAIGPMQVAGRIAMIMMEKRATNHACAIIVFLAMASSATLLMFSGNGIAFIVGFAILFGGGHGIVSIIRPMLAYEILGKENFGAKSGSLASMFFVGGAIAPYAGSLIWQAGGYDVVLLLLMVLPLVGLVLYLTANRMKTDRTGSIS